jgi:isocitrate dehydrogenase (NAD+)
MLDHVGYQDLALRLRTAITDTLNKDHVATGDLKGKASTREFTEAIIRRLQAA